MPAQENTGLMGYIKGSTYYVWDIIRNFLVASWNRVKSSTATFSSLGDDLLSSAQTDLGNLKSKLENIWTFTDEDKSTIALYLATGIGKLGFTPIIIGITLFFALFKIVAGVVCLFLGGDWLNLIRRLCGILRDLFVEGYKLVGKFCSRFAAFVSELCVNFANKIGELCIKLSAAIKNACEVIIRNIMNLGSWLATKLLNLWNGILDFVSAVCKVFANIGEALLNTAYAVKHLCVGIVKATVNVFKGAVLAVAALFFETGLAIPVSGIAKSIFILEESFAAAAGSIIDGFNNALGSLGNAWNSLVGYRPVIETQENTAQAGAASYSAWLRDGMHHFNEGVASIGNGTLNAYTRGRDEMIGASGWSQSRAATERVNGTTMVAAQEVRTDPAVVAETASYHGGTLGMGA